MKKVMLLICLMLLSGCVTTGKRFQSYVAGDYPLAAMEVAPEDMADALACGLPAGAGHAFY